MIWAKIKAALNSTLGTKDFKPLDKIIDDGFKQVSEMQDAIRETADTTLEKLESGENEYSVKNAVVAQSADIVTQYAFEKIFESSNGVGEIALKEKQGLYLIMHSPEGWIPISHLNTTFLYVPDAEILQKIIDDDGIVNSSDGEIAYSYESGKIYYKYSNRRIYMLYRLNVKVTEV